MFKDSFETLSEANGFLLKKNFLWILSKGSFYKTNKLKFYAALRNIFFDFLIANPKLLMAL